MLEVDNIPVSWEKESILYNSIPKWCWEIMLSFHKKSSHCLKRDHSKNSMAIVALTQINLFTSINVKMTAATTSSFWANSSYAFTRSSISASLFHFLHEIWKMGKKNPKTPLGTSSTETLHALASLFPNRLLFMLGTKITIIEICDKQDSWRSAPRFLSKIFDNLEQAKWLLNWFGGYSESFNILHI